jgi:peroxiredoxin
LRFEDQFLAKIPKGGFVIMETPNSKAEDFCLASAEKENVCLKDFKGKWVVLFFYSKDNTSG